MKALGQVLLSPHPEELKLVASHIISHEISRLGNTTQAFFETTLPVEILGCLPLRNEKGLHDFQVFLEKLLDCGLAKSR